MRKLWEIWNGLLPGNDIFFQLLCRISVWGVGGGMCCVCVGGGGGSYSMSNVGLHSHNEVSE